jgi:hypothetical protein
LAAEADALIPVLPLALQGIYGNETDKWFKFSARIGIEGFSFDKANNRIIPTGNNTFDELDQTWDQHAEGFKEEDLWMEGDDNEDDEFGGFAIDLGIIDLESRESRAAILNDDSASVGTTNPPPPVGFRDDTSDVDMDDDDSMIAHDREPVDLASQSSPGQLPTGLIAPAPPTTVTDSDLVQRFLNNPDLLRQLQLAQTNPSTPEEPLDPEAAQEL